MDEADSPGNNGLDILERVFILTQPNIDIVAIEVAVREGAVGPKQVKRFLRQNYRY